MPVFRQAASAATEQAEKVRAAVEDAGPKALRAVSRAICTTAYTVAYGLVYASVFVVKPLPQENALMHGLHDGDDGSERLLVPSAIERGQRVRVIAGDTIPADGVIISGAATAIRAGTSDTITGRNNTRHGRFHSQAGQA